MQSLEISGEKGLETSTKNKFLIKTEKFNKKRSVLDNIHYTPKGYFM